MESNRTLPTLADNARTKKSYEAGGTTVSILAFRPRGPGLIPSIPQNFQRKYLSILLKLINSAVLRKVDSGLKMLDI